MRSGVKTTSKLSKKPSVYYFWVPFGFRVPFWVPFWVPFRVPGTLLGAGYLFGDPGTLFVFFLKHFCVVLNIFV